MLRGTGWLSAWPSLYKSVIVNAVFPAQATGSPRQMTPAARLQMAIDILDGLAATSQPADRFLKAWFRARRFAGSGDRRAIADRVFWVQRHRARFAHRMASDCPRALVIASLIEDGENAEALFTGGYGPAPLTEAERHAIATPPLPAPAWVLGEYPQWLEPELARAFGDDVAQEMAALVPRAPVDLQRQHAQDCA